MKERYVLRSGDTIQAIAYLTDFTEVVRGDRKIWLLNRIFVPNKLRGNGHGKSLLRLICQQADRESAVLWLSVEPDDPADYERTVELYKKFSFMWNSTDEYMERLPARRLA